MGRALWSGGRGDSCGWKEEWRLPGDWQAQGDRRLPHTGAWFHRHWHRGDCNKQGGLGGLQMIALHYFEGNPAKDPLTDKSTCAPGP